VANSNIDFILLIYCNELLSLILEILIITNIQAMKNLYLLKLIIFLFLTSSILPNALAGPGDTTVVQTFNFGSAQNAWFVFPSDTVRYEKILMQYTLKCNPAQNPPCGEWDYLTYTYLYKHTGLIDSAVVNQAVFLVNENVVDSLPYSNMPTFKYSPTWQYVAVHDDTTSLDTFANGTGSLLTETPFKTSDPVSRTQYLWKASELSASGMGAGNITGMRFSLASCGSFLKNLNIHFKTTLQDSLSSDTLETLGFTEVYNHNTTFTINGWNSLQFLNPFYWDGTSNILIEITYENTSTGTTHSVISSDAGFSAGLHNSGSDRAVTMHNGSFVSVPVNDSIAAIDSVITVSFWAYGNPALQPQNGTCFEATDAASNRVINAHVPWSDLSVYWDAGNSGSTYDRINKAATTNNTEGQWNHWAFTKNAATGSMKMYLNGNLWHSGTGKLNSMKEMNKFRIGKGTANSSTSYEGRMDEFSVFSAELDQPTIKQYMKKDIDALHPFYNKLCLYYHFDDGNNMTAFDSAPTGHANGVLTGVDNALKKAGDLIYGFSTTHLRPNVIFEQGVFTSHLDSVLIIDSVANAPLQVVYYSDSINNPGLPSDTLTVWPAGYYNFLYNVSGNIVDSVLVAADSTLHLTYYNYYNHFPQVIRYELARYITPYGNGLSLGNGWMWTFDVTDYRPLLADSVHLEAGNWQELLDLRFLMIEGTPPRDVIGIQNLWNGGFNYGNASDPIESHLTPKMAYIPSNVSSARWKSRITGHGMDTPQNCAEFCAKTHYFKMDDSLRFSKLVWRDNCDLNPLYPQGGTWVYDRANWCPGAEVWTYDFEITPFITPGDSVKLDHDVQAYTNTGGWDYYQIEDQLVTYGAPNFTLDAAIEKVLSPNTDQMWSRMNPICGHPTIIIKNNGTTPLTSLKINYGIKNATPSVFNWTGNLTFQQTETVVLDTFEWVMGATKFVTSISNPNGGSDQYALNNTIETPFNYVSELPPGFIIVLKSNSRPFENSYTLKDAGGNVIFSRTGLTANTTYNDTLNLPKGCYEFRLTDTGEDGLQWWANSAQGSGYCRFKNLNNQILKVFGADFGGEIYMQFTVGLHTGVEDNIFTQNTQINIYPNPAMDEAYIDISLTSRQDAEMTLTDLFGHLISTFTLKEISVESINLDVKNLSKGVYFINLKTKDECLTRKLIVQ